MASQQVNPHFISPRSVRVPGSWLRLGRGALADTLIVWAAYSAVLFVRGSIGYSDYRPSLYFVFFASFVMGLCLYWTGVYRQIWPQTSGEGIDALITSVGLSTFIAVIVDMFFVPRPLPISVIALGNLLSLCGFVAVRYRSRLLTRVQAKWGMRSIAGNAATRVLVAGSGETATTLISQLMHKGTENSYAIVGFVDSDMERLGLRVEGFPILGDYSQIPNLVEQYGIDLVVVALDHASGSTFREIIDHCEPTTALIKVVPNVIELFNPARPATLLRDVQPEDLIGRATITHHEAVDRSKVIRKVTLVTGAAGSIGSELCRQLVQYEPKSLILLDNNESGLYDVCIDLKAKHPSVNFIPVLCSITDEATLRSLFTMQRPDLIFHAAAYKHVPMLEQYPLEALRTNVGGTRTLAELAQEYGVQRFILISTDKAVKPSSVMGASKRVCELLIQALAQQPNNRTLFTAVRFGNVLGSRGSVVPTFNRQIDDGGPILVTHPEMTRYFMSTAEAVNLVIHAACLTEGGDTFFLKMGDVVRIVDLAAKMIRLRGLRPYRDIEIQFTGIRPGEKLHEELYDPDEMVIETVHPGIEQIVETSRSSRNAARFLKRLDALWTQGFPDDTQALQELRSLIAASMECDESVA